MSISTNKDGSESSTWLTVYVCVKEGEGRGGGVLMLVDEVHAKKYAHFNKSDIE